MARSQHRRRLFRNLGLVAAGLLGLYALAGFLLLPWWLERMLPEQLARQMGWQGEVTGVRINPFALSAELDGLSATDGAGEKVLGFDRLSIDLAFFPLLRGVIGFQAIRLQQPFVRVDLLDDYRVNLARDWQANGGASTGAAPEDTAEPASDGPLRIFFEQLAIEGGELLLRDYSKPAPAEFRIAPLTLDLNDLATWPRGEEASADHLSAEIGSQVLEWHGEFSLAPLFSRGTLKVSEVSYQTLAHFLSPYLPYPLRGGRLTIQTDYELQVRDSVLLTTRNGEVSLTDLAVAISDEAEQARLSGARIAFDQVGFDLTGQQLAVGQVEVDGLALALARNEDGVLDWLAPLQAKADNAEPAAPDSGGSGFRWSVEGLRLSNGQLVWEDRVPGPDVSLTLDDLELVIGRLSQHLDEQVDYRASGRLASGGQLSVQGQVTPAPFTLAASIAGNDIALAAFEPYLREGANLTVAGGALSVDGELDLDGQNEPLTGTFSGTGEIADLQVALPDSSQPLLSWASLQLAPIEYNVSPARLEIGTVTLKAPVADLIRDRDNRLNVERIARPPAEPADDAGASPQSEEAPGLIFRIGEVVVEGGAVAYTDRTLTPAFTTRLDRLTGTVTGLSNVPPQQGKVAMTATVGTSANVDFRGVLGTLGTEDASDLVLSLRNVSLPVLSPYFGRYLGYSVDSGKMNLELDYRIEGDRLKASNLMVLDRLELGAPVVSDQAVQAPVKLGLALLRDSNGVIEVDVPVSGDLSDPDFTIGRVVLRAFGNLLVKAAASPFTMLGSIADLAGFSAEDLGQVRFLPGSVELADGEADKLVALAKALNERPDLLLNIRGGVAPEADGLALLRDELTAGGAKALSEQDWAAARAAYLAGERELPPEALNNLARDRGLAIQALMQETHDIEDDRLFLLDPTRSAGVDEEGRVTIGFTLDVR